MAAWQFDFHLLPRAAVQGQYGTLPLVISRDAFNSTDWWCATSAEDQLGELSSLLPGAQSWSPQIQRWGTEDGDRIDISRKEGRLHGVFVRVDVRVISYNFLAAILAAARKHDWVIRTQDSRVLRPSFGGMMSEIQKSDCFRFVSDPDGFIREMARRREASNAIEI